MTYTERLGRIGDAIDRLLTDGLSENFPSIEEGLAQEITFETNRIHDMALELDMNPRAPDGGGLILLASFPYTHPDDRDTRRLAIYDKPCPSGDGSGEYIIWSEVREVDHDGYREASRFNGDYTGYVGADERDAAYYQTLDKFSYKCARIVGPFVPEKNRGYRRAN